MGLPGYFKLISKKYKNIIKEKTKCKYLYIDANGIFHSQCIEFMSNFYLNYDGKTKINQKDLDNQMIDKVIDYIQKITTVANPTVKVYIAVDGVVPMAKIARQRKSRYYSQIYETMMRKIKYKYEKDIIEDKWSNIVITPGTEFMEKLHIKILNHYRSHYTNIECVYSSYHSVGEGEHKIMNEIKKDIPINTDNNDIVIYSADADIYFLSMLTFRTDIYILKEINDDDIKEYISIEYLKMNVYDHINIEELTVDELMLDYTYFCLLLGNDFIPHLPSISIKKNGINHLVESYKYCYSKFKETLVKIERNIDGEYVKINEGFMKLFLCYLSINENNHLYQLRNKRMTPSEDVKKLDSYDYNVWELDNLIDVADYDPIKINSDSSELWKYRYYNEYFKVSTCQDNLINKLSMNYLESLTWTINYYIGNVTSNLWFYRYTHAPFISDIYNFYTKYTLKNSINIAYNKINVTAKDKILNKNGLLFPKEKNIIITPLLLLCIVTPLQFKKILPLEYQKVISDKSVKHLYPEKSDLDTISKTIIWMSNPLIPSINMKAIIDLTKNAKLSGSERQRNISNIE